MKKTKKNWKELLSAALLEIVLSLIFLLIGAGVVALFGVDFSKMDSDLLILIGVVAFFLFFGGALAYFEKRRKRQRRSGNRKEDDQREHDDRSLHDTIKNHGDLLGEKTWLTVKKSNVFL